MIPIEWCPINCASIRQIKAEPNVHDERGDLLIEFNEGRVYRYKDVPFVHIENLVHHPDPGRYFHSKIRNVYEGEREET